MNSFQPRAIARASWLLHGMRQREQRRRDAAAIHVLERLGNAPILLLRVLLVALEARCKISRRRRMMMNIDTERLCHRLTLRRWFLPETTLAFRPTIATLLAPHSSSKARRYSLRCSSMVSASSAWARVGVTACV